MAWFSDRWYRIALAIILTLCLLLHLNYRDRAAGWLAAAGAILAGLLILRYNRRITGPGTTGAAPRPARTAADSFAGHADRLRLLESAVVHAHDAIIILEARPHNGHGRAVLYVNEAFCRLSGYSAEEIIGRSLFLLRGPKTDPAALESIRQALERGEPLRIELCNHRKDGTPFWVDLSLVPVPDRRGRVAHWVMIQRDITAQVAAAEALRRSEENHRQLFEANPQPMWVVEREQKRIMAVNQAAVEMYGYGREEFLRMAVPELDLGPAELVPATPSANGASPQLRQHRRRDGQLRIVETVLRPIVLDGQDAELVVIHDLTEKLRLEEQLRQAQKMEAVGQMAGGIAHDFNNIMTGILGHLALMRLSPDDPNRTLRDAVEKAALRAADLTGKLLAFARRNQLVFAAIDPAEILNEVVTLVRHALTPSIQLEVELAAHCPLVHADATLLTQALVNLCFNARDAMPQGGRLTLRAGGAVIDEATAAPHGPDARPGEFVAFAVEDTGLGMSPEVQSRIFEPFFTTKEVGKGTGLGLPMVLGIVKQHQGWIAVRSAPGAGTCITLYLPVAAAPATPPSTLRNGLPRPLTVLEGPNGPTAPSASPSFAPPANRSSAPSATPSPAPSAWLSSSVAGPEPTADGRGRTGGCILLVDDEEMIRCIGAAVLRQAGYEVLLAADGVEALEIFERECDHIDLVILDVMMPRLSGRDAYRQMVARRPDIRVLFSTGYAGEGLEELEAAAGLLHKPYRPPELLATVRQMLEEPQAAAARGCAVSCSAAAT